MDLFKYQDTTVRTITEDDQPWFVLADLCKVLGVRNARDVAARLDDDQKGVGQIDTPGGKQSMTIVNESGMYDVVLRSEKPEARPFRRWVTSEVLPTIRKTGSYGKTLELEEHKTKARIFESRAQMELCQAAKGLISADHLEAKARIILARGMGEAPELDPTRRPLYTQDYLRERGLSGRALKSAAPTFGKRVKAAYLALRGEEPGKYALTLTNGRIAQVNAYTEADRDLMDQIWCQYYEVPQGVAA
ncbi:Bro-N domain-containing protein [Rothia kristinae]|uniref:BRO-N domain-containing protein n=1 Tax=Actinomycetes TaxID=1760 RepID=UPI00343742B6